MHPCVRAVGYVGKTCIPVYETDPYAIRLATLLPTLPEHFFGNQNLKVPFAAPTFGRTRAASGGTAPVPLVCPPMTVLTYSTAICVRIVSCDVGGWMQRTHTLLPSVYHCNCVL